MYPAAIDELFGFTGRDWDKVVELQYNRARWYDPATGRWLSQDPIGCVAGDANLHRYVENGPTNATVPSGHNPKQLGAKDPEEMIRMIIQIELMFLSTHGRYLDSSRSAQTFG